MSPGRDSYFEIPTRRYDGFTEANDTLWKDMFIKYTRNASTFRDDIARDNA